MKGDKHITVKKFTEIMAKVIQAINRRNGDLDQFNVLRSQVSALRTEVEILQSRLENRI